MPGLKIGDGAGWSFMHGERYRYPVCIRFIK